MTNKQYSSTTQAVSDAIDKVYWDWGNMCPADAQTIAAAALRALVKQNAKEYLVTEKILNVIVSIKLIWK